MIVDAILRIGEYIILFTIILSKTITVRGVFRTQSDIYNGVFTSFYGLTGFTVDYFRKKALL